MVWLLVAFVSAVGSVSAHAEPVRGNPAINGVVAQAPAKLEIWFGEEIATKGLAVVVIAPNGSTADLGDAAIDLFDRNHEHVTLSLRSGLGPGTYTVQWHSVSAIDGDVADGSYVFTVGAGTPGASPAASPTGRSTPAASPAATPAPASTGGNDARFDGRAFGLSVLAGLVAAVFIWLFWRLVRPRRPR